MNRYKLYMIFGICTLILSISGTFAYYMWTSNNNALVNASVCTPTISFAGGSTINGTNMVPVLTKGEGTIKDIEVKKNGIFLLKRYDNIIKNKIVGNIPINAESENLASKIKSFFSIYNQINDNIIFMGKTAIKPPSPVFLFAISVIRTIVTAEVNIFVSISIFTPYD